MPHSLLDFVSTMTKCLLPTAIAVISAFTPEGLFAQQDVIPDAVACPECSIELWERFRVGHLPGHELMDDPSTNLVLDDRSRLWVPNSSISEIIQVYSPDGTHEIFERFGDGPGEFRRVALQTCSAGGDILQLDGIRLQRLDPTAMELEYLTTFDRSVGRLGRHTSMVQVSDSVVWLSGGAREPSILGAPIIGVNIYTGDRSLVVPSPVRRYDRMVELYAGRWLKRISADEILAAHVFTYEIDVLDESGNVTRSFVRDAPWFPPLTDPRARVRAWIQGVTLLGRDLVGVHILVADEDAPPPAIEQDAGSSLDHRFDSVLEVLDLSEGEVLARRSFPFVLLEGVCPTNEVAALIGEGVEWEQIAISRLVFRRQ